MTAGAAVPERAEQIAECLESEEVERLVGHLEARFLFAVAVAVAAALRPPVALGVEIRRRRDVAGVLHAVDDLLDQLFELLPHLFLIAIRRLAEDLLEHVVREHAAAEERLENRVVQRLHAAVVVVGRIAPRVAEAARQQQVGQFRHELVHVELVEERGDVFLVAIFHGIVRNTSPKSEVRSPKCEVRSCEVRSVSLSATSA